MKATKLLLVGVLVILAASTIGYAKDKKKRGDRGMLENMQAVPCGAKERGITGLGSVFASVGVTKVSSDEKLCPQYLLRSDQMEYHIRPVDTKHGVLLPVGQEAVFKVKKNILYLKVPDGEKEYRKTRKFHVVAMSPMNPGSTTEHTGYRSPSSFSDPPPSQAGRVANTDVGGKPPEKVPPPD